MSRNFAEALKSLRREKGYSQQQLADMLHVDRSSVASWETGRRVPDAVLIMRLSECLGTDVSILMSTASTLGEKPVVIMVDDEKLILSGNLSVVERVMPDVTVVGFTRSSEALAFAAENRVSLAFLDIEMGRTSGLELCRKLLEEDPYINVVFLTAFMDYSFDAWDTGACGFLLKPLTEDKVRGQLTKLRHPLRRVGAE